MYTMHVQNYVGQMKDTLLLKSSYRLNKHDNLKCEKAEATAVASSQELDYNTYIPLYLY